MIYKRFGKRLFDVLASGLGLIVLSPVFLLIATLVWMQLGRPLFFTQVRPGYKEKPFKIFKFRTMLIQNTLDGNPLHDEERLTKFGRFLRSSSLDELPELWNVFLGEMSVVGPRPLLMEYLSLYDENQKKRHDVKPGITGLSQVNGRNRLEWSKKLELDNYYVKHYSLLLDIKIILKTLMVVISRRGVEYDKSNEDSKFKAKHKD
jgi:lipopolysaccharide/colanic/teichoic acid biosynthesis glycosyltransferase